MTIVVTAGPAWEPIDRMRRITNASTGALGTALCDAFTRAGHEVILFRSDMATAAPPAGAARIIRFGTNDELARAMESLSGTTAVQAVCHAAALCDFRVASARAADGADIAGPKIPSRAGRVLLELEPATKILPSLRAWFPASRIVGWKFELAGSRGDAIRAALRQLREDGVDACVLNGAAWGPGFALCRPRPASGAVGGAGAEPVHLTECPDAPALAAALLAFLAA